MAEALFQQRVSAKIEVRSAGLYKFKDFPVSPYAIAVLAEYGIQYHNKPQAVNLELIAWADLILTMTKFHKYVLLARFPEISNKTFTLNEFVGSDNLDISDPVGKSLLRYRQCAQEINSSLYLLQQLLDAGVDNNSISFPSPQRLPRIFPLLMWMIKLTELNKKRSLS